MKNVQAAASAKDRAIRDAEATRGASKLSATRVRDNAIKELGKQIKAVGKQIMQGDGNLKEHTEEIKKLSTQLHDAQNATVAESAESIWKTAHDAADEAYTTTVTAEDATNSQVVTEEKKNVEDANTKLQTAERRYAAVDPPQNVPDGCKKSGGWERSAEIQNAEDCCCSICAGTNCAGVRTKPSFIDWDSCYSESAHQAYARSLFGGCNDYDGFQTTCDQCRTKACGSSKICKAFAH